MPTANHIQNSFSAGEISPRLEGRTDFEKYRDGCRTLHNFKVFPHGGVTRRGGTQFIAEVKDSSKTVRLVPFEFSITQAYILEFGDLYIRFYRDRGQIGAPYEIVSPYAEADLADLQFAQNADTMYIVHKDVAPQKLTRTGHTAWTIEDVEFLDVTQDITAITQANPAVVTITGHTLLDGDTIAVKDIVGMVELNDRTFTVANRTANTFELSGENSTGHTAYASGGTAQLFVTPPEWGAGDYPQVVTFYEQRLWLGANPNNPQTLWASKTTELENLTLGAADADALKYTIATDRVNVIRWLSPGKALIIGTVGGEFVASASTLQEALTPTNVRISRQSGYGSSQHMPVVIANSVIFIQRAMRKMRKFIANFNVDETPAEDLTILSEHITEGGISEPTYEQEADSIVWSKRSDGILVGMTHQPEHNVVCFHRHTIGGTSDAAGINAKVESLATIPDSTVSQGDETWVVMQRWVNGAVIRTVELLRNGMEDGETVEDAFFVDGGLSLDIPLGIEGITQANPAVVTITGHPLLDGATVKARDIKGMTELNKRSFTVANKTANTFELAGEDSTGHTAYISGGTIRKEETTISGLTHLEGETVTILGDGAPQPSRVVASGAIILETAASIIHVGLGFDSELETVRPDVGSADGSAQGKIKRVKEAVARFYNTVGGKIGRLNGEMDEIQFRAPSDPMDEHVPLFTGDKEIAFPKGYDTEGIVAVKQDQPLPMTLLAIVYKLKTNSL